MTPRHAAPTSDGPSLLELRGVTSGYGDLKVLDGVDLTVAAGRVEVVLGRNGVGKTTLLSTITGVVRLWNGQIELNGERIDGIPAHRRAAAGVSLVQEGKRVFHRRTVIENLVLGTYSLKISGGERRDRCAALLDRFPVLRSRTGARAGSLSGGQQQMLAIAQALAAEPKLLLLDEPSAGLAPAIVAEVFDLIQQLRDEGVTIVLVEQLADQALGIADHLTVVDRGRIVMSGDPSQFENLKQIEAAYFGRAEAPGA